MALRSPGVHLGGQWEFPGGKCEPGESAIAAALRELMEECGVQARAVRELPIREVDYGDRVIEIAPVLAEWVAGEPVAHASAAVAWVSDAELTALPMPAVNALIVADALAALRHGSQGAGR